MVKRNYIQMRDEFLMHWKAYVFQSMFATIVMFLVLLFLTLQNAVVAASVGSSAFVVFAMPDSIPARARNVIGGQIIGMLCGLLGYVIANSTQAPEYLGYAIAVGLSIFIMVVVDMEHPPASGTALGIAITSTNWNISLGVIAAVVLLSLTKKIFRKYIRDLV
ncbi:HPP family protein [bacterium]|nr:HPP family protein [bacterium]